jgi:hypothetical protein
MQQVGYEKDREFSSITAIPEKGLLNAKAPSRMDAIWKIFMNGIGAGFILAPLVVKAFGWLGCLIAFGTAALLTVLGQYQLAVYAEELGVPPSLVDILGENRSALGREIGKLAMMIFSITGAGISLQFIVLFVKNLMIEYFHSSREEIVYVTRECAVITMSLIILLWVALPKKVIAEFGRLMSLTTFMSVFITLPMTLTSLFSAPETISSLFQKTPMIQNIRDLPMGIGISTFIMCNYFVIPSALKPFGRGEKALLLSGTMGLFILPCIVMLAIAGSFVYQEKIVADVLSSTPIGWYCFTTVRIGFALSRLQVILVLASQVSDMLPIRESWSPILNFIQKILICLCPVVISFVFGNHMGGFFESTGLIQMPFLFIVLPAWSAFTVKKRISAALTLALTFSISFAAILSSILYH